MVRPPDVSMEWAAWLALLTLVLVALMVLGLLVLRALRWLRAPLVAAFEARWQPVLLASMVGDAGVVPDGLTLSGAQRWHLMRMWLHGQMLVYGESRDRLARLGMDLGFRALALKRLNSAHYAERMVGLLALGFLRDASSTPLLLQRLQEGSNHTLIYAGRALLEIDEAQHADAVARALLQCEGLDLALTSVMFKTFRQGLGQALRQLEPVPQDAAALPWLRLAGALQLLLPAAVLQRYLSPAQDPEVLMAALRLVQGEQGAAEVMALARHADWRVRAQAARALGEVGGPAEVPALLGLIIDAQWWVRHRAAQALLRVPGVARAQVLTAVQATGDRYAQSMLQSVLAQEERA